jgi:precorrin-3B C17-methyltransferase
MTARAKEAIDISDVVVGYKTYVNLIEPLLNHKETIATGMGDEVGRAKAATGLDMGGRTVSVVCGGDVGSYGMAGLVNEIISEGDSELCIEVVPGVPALAAAATLLGAPLMSDFTAISLSDYLVPWTDIKRRLALTAEGDFVIVLYNPGIKSRQRHLSSAGDIILQQRSPSTPVGMVTNSFRKRQRVVITDLAHMLEYEVGMNTTIIIGNSTTFSFDGRMVTSRGYQRKSNLKSKAIDKG